MPLNFDFFLVLLQFSRLIFHSKEKFCINITGSNDGSIAKGNRKNGLSVLQSMLHKKIYSLYFPALISGMKTAYLFFWNLANGDYKFLFCSLEVKCHRRSALFSKPGCDGRRDEERTEQLPNHPPYNLTT